MTGLGPEYKILPPGVHGTLLRPPADADAFARALSPEQNAQLVDLYRAIFGPMNWPSRN